MSNPSLTKTNNCITISNQTDRQIDLAAFLYEINPPFAWKVNSIQQQESGAIIIPNTFEVSGYSEVDNELVETNTISDLSKEVFISQHGNQLQAYQSNQRNPIGRLAITVEPSVQQEVSVKLMADKAQILPTFGILPNDRKVIELPVFYFVAVVKPGTQSEKSLQESDLLSDLTLIHQNKNAIITASRNPQYHIQVS